MTKQRRIFFILHLLFWAIYFAIKWAELSIMPSDFNRQPPPDKPEFPRKSERPPPPHDAPTYGQNLPNNLPNGMPKDVHPLANSVGETLGLMLFAYFNIFGLLPRFGNDIRKMRYWLAFLISFSLFILVFVQLKRFMIDGLRGEATFAYSPVFVFELALVCFLIVMCILGLRLLQLYVFTEKQPVLTTDERPNSNENLKNTEGSSGTQNSEPDPQNSKNTEGVSDDQNLKPETQNSKLLVEPFIFVKEGSSLVKINWADILYIEGMKDYARIHTTERKIMALQRLKNLEEQLPSDQFARIHKSYIVALSALTLIQRDKVSIGKVDLPVSDTYRKAFRERVNVKS